MCCNGCKAVAEAIVNSGHEHFYQVRTTPSATATEPVPEYLRGTRGYELELVQSQFIDRVSGTLCEASLILEGITCAACIWLNEQHIAGLAGVEQVQINYTTRRAWVRWDDSRIKLSEILLAILTIGYRAYLCNADQHQALRQLERRAQLRRMAIAGLFGMQVMMMSISLYAGAWSGMERDFEALFRWLSLGLTTPVVFYSALPFFRSAWNRLKIWQVGMDVPVSVAIGIAYSVSFVATVTAKGHVYFDSVVMFVFFLLVSRYFESMARQRSAESVERLAHALPMIATRLSKGAQSEEVIAVSELNVGDRVLVRPGETIPADGVVFRGTSYVDESLLSGESHPVSKKAGDRVIGGSINHEGPLELKVQSLGADTVLSAIQQMIERAQSDKPPLAQLADRIASWFIVAVLLIAVVVAVFWWQYDPERWLAVTLAVLIVTCPCALSLATPAAISSALGKLQIMGLLVKRGRVLEALHRVTHVVFDKTGTLTLGRPVLKNILCDQAIGEARCLQLAAALEYYSEHPLGKALVLQAGETKRLVAEDVENVPGGGLCASIEGQAYAIGSIEFIKHKTGQSVPRKWSDDLSLNEAAIVALATPLQILGLFVFDDELRPDAAKLVQMLSDSGKQVMLMTGDRESIARQVAEQTGIVDYQAGLLPEQKMARVQDLQSAEAVVLMVGDGINDAPVLSAADVSIAMGSATALAKTSADMVMLSNRLDVILGGLDMGRRTQRIIRQNFTWALGYNLVAIPAAAGGFLSPWMAAVGMSLSSLIVVMNALRLSR